MRKSSADAPVVKFMEAVGVELEKLLRERFDVRRLTMELATGRIAECPFAANITAGVDGFSSRVCWRRAGCS